MKFIDSDFCGGKTVWFRRKLDAIPTWIARFKTSLTSQAADAVKTFVFLSSALGRCLIQKWNVSSISCSTKNATFKSGLK